MYVQQDLCVVHGRILDDVLSANEWGETALSVTVVHASKVWPADLTPDQIKERVLVKAAAAAL
ncbi:MAG: hypothetical protein DMF86_25125 [Acidobacteria bacterium]|nr:MAG: hypothetical protein DMF86_25125 [Acidobacteriota bacterium]